MVRSVLLRPLVNREADRLIYIRQAADGLGLQNMTFMPATRASRVDVLQALRLE